MEKGRAGQRYQRRQWRWKQELGQRIVHFSSATAMESTLDEVSTRKKKKKFKGFPLFFIFKIFKTALFCDIKHWASLHRCHRLRYRRRHRRSRSKVEKKMLVMLS
jgi:hypothetical protein